MPAMNPMPSTKGRTETVTAEEFSSIFRAVSRRSRSGIRNRALFTVLNRAGLRLQEALDLTPRDLDLDAGTVNVRRGKGGTQGIVGMDDAACTVVARWMDVRARIGIGGRAPVFCLIEVGKQGKPLDQSYVRKALRVAAKCAGVESRVHPHCLRHSMASELVAEGVALTTVQAQLGHQNAAVTDKYLRRIAPVELVNAMRAREWSVEG